MEKWSCGICGKPHGDMPMDIAFQKPQQFFEVPEAERAERVWINAEANADLCVVDGNIFLIRGFLPIKVEGNRTFRFGVWVRVDEDAFRTYYSCDWDPDKPPAYAGQLASEVAGYPSTQDLGATVQLAGHKDRPVIELNASDHLLALEQKHGITLSRVHEILARSLPTLFGEHAPPKWHGGRS